MIAIHLEDAEVTGCTKTWTAALLKALEEQGLVLSAGPNASGRVEAGKGGKP